MRIVPRRAENKGNNLIYIGKDGWHMILGTNMSAVISASYLSASEKKLRGSLEKLSSGYKINHSKDDAAGMAISEKMRTQIKGLEQASRNASDGISVTQTAEGALSEVEAMLQRMNELAVQGANETYTQEDRDNMAKEIESLKKEIDRISTDTDFNSTTLLNGDMQRRAYATNTDATGEKHLLNGIRVSYMTNNVEAGNYGLTIAADGMASFSSAGGNRVGFSDTAMMIQDGNKVKVTDSDGFEMDFTIYPEAGVTGDVTFEVWDIGTMPIQIGANEGQLLDICIPEVSSETLNLDLLDFSNSDASAKSIDIIADAISKVSKVRSELGAYQNRLEYSVTSLDISEENMTAAFARIRDVDMAEEMTNYTQLNVMQQTDISMLAQANQMPEKILQVLQ